MAEPALNGQCPAWAVGGRAGDHGCIAQGHPAERRLIASRTIHRFAGEYLSTREERRAMV